MRKNFFRAAGRLEVYVIVLLAPLLVSWGPAGHEPINRAAVLALPEPIQAFFYNHIFESQLHEMFIDKYRFNIKDAVYIQDVPKEIGRFINATHLLVDTLLMTEQDLNQQFPAEKVYLLDQSGKIQKTKFNSSVHYKAYAEQYHKELKGMVEMQLRLAMTATSNFWYTA